MESIKCLDGVKHSEILKIYTAVTELLEKNRKQESDICFDLEEQKDNKIALLLYKRNTSAEELVSLKQKLNIEGDIEVFYKGKNMLTIKIVGDRNMFLSLINKPSSVITPGVAGRGAIPGTGQKSTGTI